jgi:hypothetical protein
LRTCAGRLIFEVRKKQMLEKRLASGRRLLRAARSHFGWRRWLLCISFVTLAAAIVTIYHPQQTALVPGGFIPVAQIAGTNWRYDLNFPGS